MGKSSTGSSATRTPSHRAMVQYAWKVTIDEYAKVLDPALRPGARYLMSVMSDHLNFVPITNFGIKCCASDYNVALDKIEGLDEVQAEYSSKSLVIRLKPEPVPEGEEDYEEDIGPKYHKMWFDGSDADLAACVAKIKSSGRLLGGDVIVSGYIDSVTCEPTFFPASVGVELFNPRGRQSSVSSRRSLLMAATSTSSAKLSASRWP